jgi:hypothetical protein
MAGTLLPRFRNDNEGAWKGAPLIGNKRGRIDDVAGPGNENPYSTNKSPFVKISPGTMMAVAVMCCLASCLTNLPSDSTNDTAADVPYVGRNILGSHSPHLTSSVVVDMWHYTANAFLNLVFLGIFGVGVSTLHTVFTRKCVEYTLRLDSSFRFMVPNFMLSKGKTKHS